MKKITIIVFSLLLLNNILTSQINDTNIKLNWGQKETYKTDNYFYKIIGQSNEDLFVMRRHHYYHNYIFRSDHILLQDIDSYTTPKVIFSIYLYDNDLQKTSTKEIYNTKKSPDTHMLNCFFLNDKMQLLISQQNSNTNQLILQEIDKNTLSVVPENDKTLINKTLKKKGKDILPIYSMHFAPDGSKILIKYRYPSDNNKKYGIAVFDSSFHLIWEKEITVEKTNWLSFEVDNTGNVYILQHRYEGIVASRIKDVYSLLCYSQNGLHEKTFPIDVPGYFLNKIDIVSIANDVACCGYFSNKSYAYKPHSSAIGVYYLRVTGNKQVKVAENSFKFKNEFIIQNRSEKERAKFLKKTKKGKDIEIENLQLIDLVVVKDNLVLIGEQFFKLSGNVSQTGREINPKYDYDDIIITSFSKTGTVVWNRKISKRQKTENKGSEYFSFFHFPKDSALLFIYNDNKKNANLLETEEPYTYGNSKEGGTLFLTKIYTSGCMTKEEIFTYKESDFIVHPYSGRRHSNNEIVFFCNEEKKEGLIVNKIEKEQFLKMLFPK